MKVHVVMKGIDNGHAADDGRWVVPDSGPDWTVLARGHINNFDAAKEAVVKDFATMMADGVIDEDYELEWKSKTEAYCNDEDTEVYYKILEINA